MQDTCDQAIWNDRRAKDEKCDAALPNAIRSRLVSAQFLEKMRLENAQWDGAALGLDIEEHRHRSQCQGGDKRSAQSKNNHCSFPSYVIIMMPLNGDRLCLRMACAGQSNP